MTGAWASPAAANIKDATITDDPQHTIPKLADRINRMAVTSAQSKAASDMPPAAHDADSQRGPKRLIVQTILAICES